MPRMVDANCPICGYQVRDRFMVSPPDVLYHDADDGTVHAMDYVYVPRVRSAEWSDRDAVVVFRKPDGSYSYPGRNDAPTPRGCERIVMKSLRAVERFERETGTRNEAVWYDRGSGRGAEDDVPRRAYPTEEQRLASFMKGWNG